MTKPYVPTEDEFIDTYAENVRVFHPERPAEAEEARDEARRFLAQVRAEARREGAVEALREAADDWSDWDALSAPEDWLRARADRIEAEG